MQPPLLAAALPATCEFSSRGQSRARIPVAATYTFAAIEMGALRAAAIFHWIVGLGFGIPAVLGIRNLAAGRGILYVMGFPAYGKGPFERIGVQSSVPLLSAFLAVCVLECIAGWLLWGGAKAGAVLSLALLPVGAVFWWGFALPFPPIFATMWTVLIVLNWQQLQ